MRGNRGAIVDRFGNGKSFPVLWRTDVMAKVALQVQENWGFSGFACSYEQAKRRRKHGETR
jgi:hypothetical protein